MAWIRKGEVWVLTIYDEGDSYVEVFTNEQDAYASATGGLIDDYLPTLAEYIAVTAGRAKWQEVYDMLLRHAYESGDYKAFFKALFRIANEYEDFGMGDGRDYCIGPCDIKEWVEDEGPQQPLRLEDPLAGGRRGHT